MLIMKLSQIALATAALTLSVAASAQTTVYTTLAGFTATLAPGAYTETFDDESAFTGNPDALFSGGAFAYTVAAPGSLYGNGVFIGTNLPNEALTITFSGAAVTAVGGNFYATNIADAFQAVAITLTLSNGFTTTFTPTSAANSFRGFTTTVPIASLTLGAPGEARYVGMDNLTVGAIPEPGTWMLMALGIGALVLRQTRRAAQA
jgi:hypothetical protein